ncbi:MAG: hypothetical protein GY696_31975 [Gammaproteobacteria bacterium]|nr:hypothetical protein [Gammaproteobacteria bacterium]
MGTQGSVPNLGPKAEALFAFLRFPKTGDANPTKTGNKDDPCAPLADGVKTDWSSQRR